jgi:hypothetical protein
MTNGITDPAEQWSDLLGSLTGQRREAVVDALRSSAQQGWPAHREAVRLLVAYANGEIDAQDYAVGIVISLGGHQGMVHQQSVPRAAEERWAASQQLARPAPVAPAPVAPPGDSFAPEPRITREEAVAAYVSGRITVEEFLRITRGVSA